MPPPKAIYKMLGGLKFRVLSPSTYVYYWGGEFIHLQYAEGKWILYDHNTSRAFPTRDDAATWLADTLKRAGLSP